MRSTNNSLGSPLSSNLQSTSLPVCHDLGADYPNAVCTRPVLHKRQTVAASPGRYSLVNLFRLPPVQFAPPVEFGRGDDSTARSRLLFKTFNVGSGDTAELPSSEAAGFVVAGNDDDQGDGTNCRSRLLRSNLLRTLPQHQQNGPCRNPPHGSQGWRRTLLVHPRLRKTNRNGSFD